MLPRGIRNHNPGNIEHGAKWRGLADRQPDTRFCTFQAAAWGLRAMARILRTYQEKHGLRTVAQLVGRWAPPGENNTGAYARHVADRVGVGVDDPLDLADDAVLAAVIAGMVLHENGAPTDDQIAALYPGGRPADLPPGEWYTPATVARGVVLEGAC